jgi:gamma-glutamylcyclotransferase (GGCT)/AIG2-like uncharacterized protein YtfP
MPQHLFVYGTLRSDSPHPLARRLQGQAKLVGKASASGLLYDLGGYPGALFRSEGRERIVGEVFALRNVERLLEQLDAYEGVIDLGSRSFKRIEIKVRLDRRGVIDAWAYGLTEAPARPRLSQSGDLRRRKGRPVRS